MRFAIFVLHLSKVLRLPRKIDASTLLQSEGSEGGQRAFVKEVNDIYGSQVNGRSWPPGTAELGWLCGISGVWTLCNKIEHHQRWIFPTGWNSLSRSSEVPAKPDGAEPRGRASRPVHGTQCVFSLPSLYIVVFLKSQDFQPSRGRNANIVDWWLLWTHMRFYRPTPHSRL